MGPAATKGTYELALAKLVAPSKSGQSLDAGLRAVPCGTRCGQVCLPESEMQTLRLLLLPRKALEGVPQVPYAYARLA